MVKIMAVLDSDSMYATRFMEYIKNRSEYDFEIMVFTMESSLMEYIKNYRIEILLVGEGFKPEELPKENIKYIYILSEKAGSSSNDFPSIFKFQQAKKVMSEIISNYLVKESEILVSRGSNKLEIRSIFTPCPDAGKTIFTWSFALCMSERKKVLFIPLLLFPVPVVPDLEEPTQALSDFIYFLKEKSSNLITKMKTLLHYNGNLSYIYGLSHGFDLLSLTKEDMERWLEELKENTDYEEVIFYIGAYSDACMEIVKNSNKVFLPIEDNTYEQAVINEWERQAGLSGVDLGKERLRKILFPYHNDQQSFYRSFEDLKYSKIGTYVQENLQNLIS